MADEVECKLRVEERDANGVLKSQFSQNKALVTFGRSGAGGCIAIKVEAGSQQHMYRLLGGLAIHTRFLVQGKATIQLSGNRVQLMLACNTPRLLETFLKSLAIKYEETKSHIRQLVSGGGATGKRKADDARGVGAMPKRSRAASRMLGETFRAPFEPISPVNESLLSDPKSKFSTSRLEKREQINCEDDGEENAPSGFYVSVKKAHLMKELSEEQKRVVKAVLDGKNVFFTGSAGTGKSHLLKVLTQILPRQSTVFTASTGVAASSIGGQTIHSFSGVNEEIGSSRSLERAMKRSRLPTWQACKVLVVDEISMISGQYLDLLNYVARRVKKKDRPFGGIQVVFCGDFFQLPPVSKNGDTKSFAFDSSIWRSAVDKCIELTRVFRQRENDFIDLLHEVRLGKSSPQTLERLRATANNDLPNDGIIATKLFSHRADVDAVNREALEALAGEKVVFKSVDAFHSALDGEAMKRMIDQQVSVPKEVALKVGAQVMLRKNLNYSAGLTNGSRGVVTRFSSFGVPVVRFYNGAEELVSPETYYVKNGGETVATRKQVPLTLAWCVSIHKSQGLTLDAVEMSLSKVFECGQAYVALSRARSLAGLRVTDISEHSIKADPRVVAFYKAMQA